MSTFVYSRDMHRIMNELRLVPVLAPHYERVAPGIDVLAPVLTDEQLATEAHIVSTAFNGAFYASVQRDLAMSTARERTNRRPFSKKWHYYNDSHGPRGRKPAKPRQLIGSQHRVLH